MGWGRTDGGVHAQGAVVTVDLTLDEVRSFATRGKPSTDGETEKATTEAEKAATFLHGVLKEFACNTGIAGPCQRFGSIGAKAVVPVPADFDARYSSVWKRYVYYICSGGDVESPFVWTRYSWKMKESLDMEAMVDAAELLSGKQHNFEWLSVIQAGEMRDPHRTVQLTVERVPIIWGDGNSPYFLQKSETAVVYKITGTCDFFLYRMMRRIVGLLVAIGKHQVDLSALKTCLENYDDHRQPKMKIPMQLLQTAPAKGLCLEHIEYNIPI